MKTLFPKLILICSFFLVSLQKVNATASVTIATTTGGLAANPIDQNQNGIGIFGFSVTGAGGSTSTITAIAFSASQNILNYFPTVSLYSYTSATFPGTSSATLLKSVTAPSSTTLNISGLSQSIANGATKYYFLVVDYTIPSASATFKFSLTGVTGTGYTGGTKAGTVYTLTAPVYLGTATTTGFAADPLDHTQTGIGILGFSVTTDANLTITSFNLSSTQPIGNIGTYFATFRLFCNTSANSFTGSSQVTGATFSTVNSTTLTVSGISQSINTTTKYYFIVADYTVASASSSTFMLSANSASTSTTTYSYGGSIDGNNYTVSASTLNWLGTNSNNWSLASNWAEGRVPSTYDIVQLAVSNSLSGSNSVATISTSGTTTIAGLVFAGYFSSGNVNYPGISVASGSTLNITGDISVNVDANPGSYNYTGANGTLPTNQYYFNGNGTIQAANLFIYANYGSTSASTTQQAVISSINRLTLTGNLNLTSENYKSGSTTYNQYASLFVTGGTTEIDGQVNTNNTKGGTGGNTYPASTLEVAPSSSSGATLELDGATALAGLSALGTNYIDFNDTYADVDYAGTNQTIYTSGAANVSGGISYYDLDLTGTGTATPATGTLTIGDILTTSASTTNFSTNTPTVSIGNDWINSGNITQGGANITVTDAVTNSSNTITCGSGTLTVGGQFTNNSTFLCGSGSVIYQGGYLNTSTFTAGSGTVFFTGTQTLQDNSSAGTTFKKVTFNSGTSTISSGTGNFAIASTGYLSMLSNANLVAGTTTVGGAAYLTLMSNGTSTATVSAIGGTSTIKGNVNVQRYLTGGSGYRGYRLLSSPVNISTSFAGTGNLSLAYLNTSNSFGGSTYRGAFTAGPGTGFQSTTTNPTMFLYDESATVNNATYVSGKNVGIYAITTNTVTISAGKPAVQTTLRNIPVGNGFLFYFIGDNSSTVTTSTRVPENTTLTSSGYLNQGNVAVNFWSKTNSATNTFILYHTGTGAATPGVNQVGNPYASTIDLKQVYADNSASISPVFWMMDEPSGTYISYKASDSTYSNARASRFITSGQGFIIIASAASKTFTFKETEKVTYPTMTATTTTTTTPHGGTFLLSVRLPSNTDSAKRMQAKPGSLFGGLHLQVAKDSLTYTQTGIYFGGDRSDSYNKQEDALDLDGSNPRVYISSYSNDGQRLSINELGDYAKGKRVKLFVKATTSGLYNISLNDIHNVDTTLYNVYLVDKLHNDSLDIVRYKSYAFDLNAADTTTFGANRFVLAVERKPLPPYQLISFTGQKVTGGVQVNWKTYNEGNFTGFVLQKQGANKQFTALQSLQSSGATNYSYVDHSPLNGSNIYRLQQNDIDGNITYSDPVTVAYSNSTPTQSIFTIYPNPATELITVNLTSITKKSASYTSNIYNTAGGIVGHRIVSGDSWTEDVTAFKSGIYVIELKGSDGAVIGKSKFVKTN